ncbi:MAG: type IV pilus twitching motility protein PilT [candidate division WOR-3 bacterium]
MPEISRKYQLEDLLTTCAEQEASDLHLVVGRNPTLRIDGALVPLVKKDILSPRDTEELAQVILNDEQWAIFNKNLEIDLSYDFKGKARFRVNIYRERGHIAIALRFISSRIRTLEELNLPQSLANFTHYSQGLVLVVGPTGHGKSTTLAALIDIINHTRNDHIITIEDPIEYLFEQNRCLINQREVNQDTKSFADALRHIFRQDPDVIMIGEMRDLETISIALTAAETGHLVFTTLHTNSAAQTVDRIIDSFPGHQQPQVRTQLASSLLGIISQRLIPRIDGGLIPAVEILFANPAIRNLIREGKTHEIDLVISTSSAEGMISLDQSLAQLIKQGKVTLENGEMFALNRKNLKTLLQS